jgi:hypothetical protein
VQRQTEALGLRFLGEIPYDARIELAIGDVKKLLGTVLAKKVKEIAQSL